MMETWRRWSTFWLARTLKICTYLPLDLFKGLLIRKKFKIILTGVRNVLLASLGDTMETWRRRSTSWLARTLKIYTDLLWGLIKWFLMREKIKLIFTGVRNLLLASLGDTMETWRRRSTSLIARTLKIYTDLLWGLIKGFLMIEKNQNDLYRSQERPLSFLGWHDGDMEETEYFLNS